MTNSLKRTAIAGLPIIWSFFLISSCSAQRNTSSTKTKIEIWNPDDTSETIEVVPRGDEPYLPAELRRQFGEAAKKGLADKNFGLQGLIGISAENQVQDLASGKISAEEFAESQWPREEDDARLLYLIQKTQKELLAPSGGMFRGDIFAEGNFRRRVWFGDVADSGRNTQGGAERITTLDKLMNWQPWYRWNTSAKVLEPQSKGAARRLLEHLQAMNHGAEFLTLYRGAGQVPGKYVPAATDPYQKPLKEANLIFATPSRSGALKFASPYLLTAKIPFKELFALTEGDRPSLYVGVEFDYVELAFLITQAPKSVWFSAFGVECTQGTKVENFAQCPAQ